MLKISTKQQLPKGYLQGLPRPGHAEGSLLKGIFSNLSAQKLLARSMQDMHMASPRERQSVTNQSAALCGLIALSILRSQAKDDFLTAGQRVGPDARCSKMIEVAKSARFILDNTVAL
jgi:hypothetical protein